MNDYFEILHIQIPSEPSYHILSCPMCEKRVERKEFNGSNPVTVQSSCPCGFVLEHSEDSGSIFRYGMGEFRMGEFRGNNKIEGEELSKQMDCFSDDNSKWACANQSYFDGGMVNHYFELNFPVTKEKIQDIYKKLKRLSYYG